MTTPDCLSDITYHDVLDSRNLEEWIDDLESIDDRDADQQAALDALLQLRADCAGAGWEHGIGFIRETYFKDYCEELATDCGYLSDLGSNPLANYIDWEAWARDCRHDYSSSKIDGITYYWREA